MEKNNNYTNCFVKLYRSNGPYYKYYWKALLISNKCRGIIKKTRDQFNVSCRKIQDSITITFLPMRLVKTGSHI